MSGEKISENLLNNNLAIWCQAMQKYYFHKTEEEIEDKSDLFGLVPSVRKRKLILGCVSNGISDAQMQ